MGHAACHVCQLGGRLSCRLIRLAGARVSTWCVNTRDLTGSGQPTREDQQAQASPGPTLKLTADMNMCSTLAVSGDLACVVASLTGVSSGAKQTAEAQHARLPAEALPQRMAIASVSSSHLAN